LVEAGQGLEEVLVKRVRETTGLSVEVTQPITTVTHQYTHHKITLHGFLCRVSRGDARVQLVEAAAGQWVFPEQLGDFGFPAGPRKILEYIDTSCPEILMAK
jgi:ADP-ribose pyrophosphatase YjhB (NUDIX family)